MASTLQGMSTADKLAGIKIYAKFSPAGRGAQLVKAILGVVLNSSSDGITDQSASEGTSDDVNDFVDELDSISEPQSDDKNIRVLKPGIKVDDLKAKAPGQTGANGRNKTQEGGNIGVHESSSTTNSDGSRAKTLGVSRPNGSANKKYREND